MQLRPGSQHGCERSGGISIPMRIHPGRGASHYTCCVTQRPQSATRTQLPRLHGRHSPRPDSILQLSQTSEQKQRLSFPSASLPSAGPRRRLSSFTSALLSGPIQSCVAWTVLPPQKRFTLEQSLTQCTVLAHLPYNFGVSFKLRLLNFKIPKYL